MPPCIPSLYMRLPLVLPKQCSYSTQTHNAPNPRVLLQCSPYSAPVPTMLSPTLPLPTVLQCLLLKHDPGQRRPQWVNKCGDGSVEWSNCSSSSGGARPAGKPCPFHSCISLWTCQPMFGLWLPPASPSRAGSLGKRSKSVEVRNGCVCDVG